MNDSDKDPADARDVLPVALVGAAARLALRQQNLRVLVPVLLHEVNGSLNGLALSTELLSRVLPARESDDAAANAASLLQRSRNELGRLKQALKGLELRLLPGTEGLPAPRRTPFAKALEDVQSLLMPAVRRGQLEWRLAPEVAAKAAMALRPEDGFDLLAGFAIVAIDAAAPRSVLELVARLDGPELAIEMVCTGATQATLTVELHRELLRVVVAGVGGRVEWQQSGRGSRARMVLPAADDTG